MNVGSLFAGIGGFDLGFERAGMRVSWQVEQDPYCRAVLARHFPEAACFEDVREVGARNLDPIDLLWRRAEIVRGRPVRVSVEQAAGLQGFRHHYPWQGSRSQRFAQIGNTVPPPVAARVLAEAMRPTLRRRGKRHG